MSNQEGDKMGITVYNKKTREEIGTIAIDMEVIKENLHKQVLIIEAERKAAVFNYRREFDAKAIKRQEYLKSQHTTVKASIATRAEIIEKEIIKFASLCKTGSIGSLYNAIDRVTSQRKWGDYPYIRAMNSYSHKSNTEGLSPSAFGRVCRQLNIAHRSTSCLCISKKY